MVVSTPANSRAPSPAKVGVVDLSGNSVHGATAVQRFNNGWTNEQEELMAGWADIASSYRWMHDKCEKKLSFSNMSITVPVIILSTLTGSANFMLQSISGGSQEIQKYAQLGIGAVSIFTGILTTLGNFFRYAQTSESNRVASIAWGKFQRQVAVELALHPKERLDSLDFLKICRSELDRLIEQSPPIPDDIIKAFENEFKDLPDLKRPDIAHGMDHTKVFNDKNARTKQIIADAVQMLKQKRKVWHEHMMPEVDRRLHKVVSDLSGTLFASMQGKVTELETIVKNQTHVVEQQKKSKQSAITIARSFLRIPTQENSRKKVDNSASSLFRASTRHALPVASDNVVIPVGVTEPKEPFNMYGKL